MSDLQDAYNDLQQEINGKPEDWSYDGQDKATLNTQVGYLRALAANPNNQSIKDKLEKPALRALLSYVDSGDSSLPDAELQEISRNLTNIIENL